jgi:hypothetical protein
MNQNQGTDGNPTNSYSKEQEGNRLKFVIIKYCASGMGLWDQAVSV